MALLTIQEIEHLAPVFRGKAGNALANFLLKALKIQRINEINDSISHLRGANFAQATNEAAGIKYTVNGMPREQAIEHFRKVLPEGPFITISNHPIGSLDGTMLIDFIGHTREDFKVMVNEILYRFEGLRPSLIRVNPNGNSIAAPTAQSVSGVREAMQYLKEGHVLGVFPSGAVSDLKPGRRPHVEMPAPFETLSYTEPRVRDRDWQIPIIRFIQKMGLPVVPIRFLDGNSAFYYRLGLIDWKVRLLRLPSEMLNKEGKTMRIAVGPTIPPDSIKEAGSLEELRAMLRASVYSLK